MSSLQNALRKTLTHAREQGETVTLYRVWDRRTPRHKWRIVVHTEDKNRALIVAQHQKKKIADYAETPAGAGWVNGQVGIETMEYSRWGPLPVQPVNPVEIL